jgi:replicative DNA helicase
MSARFDPDTLPWSPEAEQSVLGALMLDPAAALRIADRQLQASHFYDARHGAVWAAVADLSTRGLPVDVLTVFERLQAFQKAEAAGGLVYLNKLAQSVPSAANIHRYADIVLDKALRRAIVDAAGKAQDIAQQSGDADDALDKVASLFAGLKRTRARASPRQMSELVAQRIDHWQALADGSIEPGTPTGLDALDSALGGGVKPGKVIVIAARPSVGKTSLAAQIALNIGNAGKASLILSQEMSAGDLTDRVAANLGHIPLDRLTAGRFDDDDWTRMAEAADTMARLPVHVDDQPALTLLDIRAKVREVQQHEPMPLVLVIVDYVQLCAPSGAAQHRHHQIEAISRGMKTLAKEAGLCVMVLSQLNRASETDEPELHHLKESGAIEEDADTVLMLHPCGNTPDGAMTVLAKIPKNRQGRRGRLALSFDGRLQRWATSSADVSRQRNK